MEPPRSLQQRKQDTLGRLESDVDAWIATADAGGDAYMVPLSFLRDGAGVVIATPRPAPSAGQSALSPAATCPARPRMSWRARSHNAPSRPRSGQQSAATRTRPCRAGPGSTARTDRA